MVETSTAVGEKVYKTNRRITETTVQDIAGSRCDAGFSEIFGNGLRRYKYRRSPTATLLAKAVGLSAGVKSDKKIDSVSEVVDKLDKKIDSVNKNVDRKLEGASELVNNKIYCVDKKIDSVRDIVNERMDMAEEELRPTATEPMTVGSDEKAVIAASAPTVGELQQFCSVSMFQPGVDKGVTTKPTPYDGLALVANNGTSSRSLVYVRSKNWKRNDHHRIYECHFDSLQKEKPRLFAMSGGADEDIIGLGDSRRGNMSGGSRRKKPRQLTKISLASVSWSVARIKGRGKREISEKACRTTASSGTIPTCENPVTRPGIELGSPWCEASVPNAQPPLPRRYLRGRYSVTIGRRLRALAEKKKNVLTVDGALIASIGSAEIWSLGRGRHKEGMWSGINTGALARSSVPMMINRRIEVRAKLSGDEHSARGCSLAGNCPRLEDQQKGSPGPGVAGNIQIPSREPTDRCKSVVVVNIGNLGSSVRDGEANLLVVAQQSRRGGGSRGVEKYEAPDVSRFPDRRAILEEGEEWLPDRTLPTFTHGLEVMAWARKGEDGVGVITELSGFPTLSTRSRGALHPLLLSVLQCWFPNTEVLTVAQLQRRLRPHDDWRRRGGAVLRSCFMKVGFEFVPSDSMNAIEACLLTSRGELRKRRKVLRRSGRRTADLKGVGFGYACCMLVWMKEEHCRSFARIDRENTHGFLLHQCIHVENIHILRRLCDVVRLEVQDWPPPKELMRPYPFPFLEYKLGQKGIVGVVVEPSKVGALGDLTFSDANSVLPKEIGTQMESSTAVPVRCRTPTNGNTPICALHESRLAFSGSKLPRMMQGRRQPLQYFLYSCCSDAQDAEVQQEKTINKKLLLAHKYLEGIQRRHIGYIVVYNEKIVS
ncbi:hypothetical protein PR048_014299 [Dryococelus australis]|uniref:Uncharacterized protein n=1 Tax=Dryococelus australis TaxID=614101 RepID=A0ABQ9HEL0_9NEOP|nr:hypothetical protein PR048_014299 [Dryococelus australis]